MNKKQTTQRLNADRPLAVCLFALGWVRNRSTYDRSFCFKNSRTIVVRLIAELIGIEWDADTDAEVSTLLQWQQPFWMRFDYVPSKEVDEALPGPFLFNFEVDLSQFDQCVRYKLAIPYRSIVIPLTLLRKPRPATTIKSDEPAPVEGP